MRFGQGFEEFGVQQDLVVVVVLQVVRGFVVNGLRLDLLQFFQDLLVDGAPVGFVGNEVLRENEPQKILTLELFQIREIVGEVASKQFLEVLMLEQFLQKLQEIFLLGIKNREAQKPLEPVSDQTRVEVFHACLFPDLPQNREILGLLQNL